MNWFLSNKKHRMLESKYKSKKIEKWDYPRTMMYKGVLLRTLRDAIIRITSYKIIY